MTGQTTIGPRMAGQRMTVPRTTGHLTKEADT